MCHGPPHDALKAIQIVYNGAIGSLAAKMSFYDVPPHPCAWLALRAPWFLMAVSNLFRGGCNIFGAVDLNCCRFIVRDAQIASACWCLST